MLAADAAPLATPLAPNASEWQIADHAAHFVEGNLSAVTGLDIDARLATLSLPEPRPATVAVSGWEALDPLGSLIYRRSYSGSLVGSEAFDDYVLQLDAGQTVTVVVETDAALEVDTQLIEIGTNATLLASASSTSGGETLLLQTIAIATSGEHRLQVSKLGAADGDYTVTVLLNAHIEEESVFGVANDTSGTAEDVNASAISLGGGLAGRLAVVGGRGLDWQEDFEQPLDPNEWLLESSSAGGQVAVSSVRGAAAGDNALILGRPLGTGLVRNSATWTVDLSSISGDATLSFFHADFGDEQTALPASFTNVANGDGVAISADGTTWHTVLNATNVAAGVWQEVTIDLDQAAANAGITLGANFQIRFQQYDNNRFDHPTDPDGRGYDEIRITTTPAQIMEDWYTFELQDGEAVTVAMAEWGRSHAGAIHLYDASLSLIASGTAGDELARVIPNFLDTTSNGTADTYFVQVTEPAEHYAVVVTQDATFDIEHNDAISTAQPLAPSGQSLGYLNDQTTASLDIRQNFPGPDFTGLIPPDPILAVGPQQIVAMVNSELAIYDKTGNELFSQSIIGSNGFFANVGAVATVFDPWVIYDQHSERFFVVAIDVEASNLSNVYLAVSTSSTPTDGGSWHKYQFDFTHDPEPLGLGLGAHFPDYEKISVTDDAVFISGNYFPIASGEGVYAGITAFDKAPLLTGAPATIVYEEFFEGFSVFPLMPINGGNTQYFAETRDPDFLRIHALTDVVNNPAATRQFIDLPIAAIDEPTPVPQLGASVGLNAVSSRVMTGVWRDGSAYFAHAVQDPALGDGENLVRWYQVATNDLATGGSGNGGVDPVVTRSGDIDPGPGVHAWMPGLAVDQAGNVAVGFSIGGPSMYAGAAFAGIIGSATSPVVTYAPGEGPYVRQDNSGRNRWGDYTGMAVDPEDDTTFWVMNQYATAANLWTTQIASFQLAPAPDTDVYELDVEANDSLVIETFTPFDGPFDLLNDLDPTLTLIDPAGNEVDFDDNGAVDGRNARIEHVATQSGRYRIRVASALGLGEYLLSVQGAGAADPPPIVIDTNPDTGQILQAFPSTYQVVFSEPIAAGSVQPGDLTVDGVPALSVELSGNVATFTLDPPLNPTEGIYNVEIPAGAVADLQGGLLAATYQATFQLDLVGPRIVSTRWNGLALPADATFLPGPLAFEADLSEDIFVLTSARRGPLSPASDDVLLERILDSTANPPVKEPLAESFVNYDATTDIFLAEYADLPEGNYLLTLFSGAGAFEDDAGNDLDGEPTGGSADATPTGDGIPGGNYQLAFTVDAAQRSLLPFERVEPLGGLIARSQGNAGFVNNPTDLDAFLFEGAANQVVTTQIVPERSVVVTVELVTVGGTMLASATSEFPGGPATLPLTSLPADDGYELRITAAGETQYDFDVWLNTAVEMFGEDVSETDPLAITDSFVSLGSGRWAAVGRSEKTYGFDNYNDPDLFVDISETGLELNLTDDGEAFILTTIGNELMPAGTMTVGNNGALLEGVVNLYFRNLPLPAPDLGRGLFAFWDDLGTSTTNPENNVYVEQKTIDGIPRLIVQWNQMPHFGSTGDATFQLQLFATGSTLARFVYPDVDFGDPIFDFGGSATIGYQESDFLGWEYNFGDLDNPFGAIPPSNPVANGDVVDIFRDTDLDEYTIDLSGHIGSRIDLVLSGLDGADFSQATFELVDSDGNVVAMSSDQPSGIAVTNYDRAIHGHLVENLGTNLYTVRVATTTVGQYSIVVSEQLQFDSEPNDAAPLRDLALTPAAIGFLDASNPSDMSDTYTLPVSAGQSVIIRVETPFSSPTATPLNSLAPTVVVRDAANQIVATTAIALPGAAFAAGFMATVSETMTVSVVAQGGLGEYLLGVEAFGTDFGDAPAPLPTLIADNGARHAVTGPLLGTLRDGELDGVPSANADGDDLTGSDDEDGVAVGPIVVGQTGASWDVTISDAPQGAFLSAWIDFNLDGAWTVDEQVASSIAVVDGLNELTFDVPAAAQTGLAMVRFRVGSSLIDDPTGWTPDGEVEDYAVEIVAPPTLAIDDVMLSEGDSGTTTFTFTITRSHNINAVSVDVATLDGDALAGSDYTSLSTNVTFAAGGALTQTVMVEVTGDGVVEPDEMFTVNLSSPVGATLAQATGTGTILNDDAAPRITSVRLGGSNWASSFKTFIDPALQLGYVIPQGPEQAATLPWVNIDRIYVEFSKEVINLNSTTVVLDGSDALSRDYSGIIVDAPGPTTLLTIALPAGTFLLSDRLRIQISDAVTDIAGNALDGEWENDAQMGPSGDPSGQPGGSFDFRVNVLPGDVNQSGRVFSNDTSAVRLRQLATPASTLYLRFADLDGSGRIFSNDTSAVRARQLAQLPPEDPFGVPAIPLAIEQSGSIHDSSPRMWETVQIISRLVDSGGADTPDEST